MQSGTPKSKSVQNESRFWSKIEIKEAASEGILGTGDDSDYTYDFSPSHTPWKNNGLIGPLYIRDCGGNGLHFSGTSDITIHRLVRPDAPARVRPPQRLLYVDRLGSRWARKAKKAIRAQGWGVPGLTWLPGVDRDPFGHDDVDHDDEL